MKYVFQGILRDSQRLSRRLSNIFQCLSNPPGAEPRTWADQSQAQATASLVLLSRLVLVLPCAPPTLYAPCAQGRTHIWQRVSPGIAQPAVTTRFLLEAQGPVQETVWTKFLREGPNPMLENGQHKEAVCTKCVDPTRPTDSTRPNGRTRPTGPDPTDPSDTEPTRQNRLTSPTRPTRPTSTDLTRPDPTDRHDPTLYTDRLCDKKPFAPVSLLAWQSSVWIFKILSENGVHSRASHAHPLVANLSPPNGIAYLSLLQTQVLRRWARGASSASANVEAHVRNH